MWRSEHTCRAIHSSHGHPGSVVGVGALVLLVGASLLVTGVLTSWST